MSVDAQCDDIAARCVTLMPSPFTLTPLILILVASAAIAFGLGVHALSGSRIAGGTFALIMAGVRRLVACAMRWCSPGPISHSKRSGTRPNTWVVLIPTGAVPVRVALHPLQNLAPPADTVAPGG